mmetsp:Transcript_20242/g.27359  ORF Transcript_20242/g.27359 Transcript_20242/m.27359 type:complete len:124 (-) Transcript_20242:111-482(-)
MKGSGQNGLGLNLELVKIIGFQIAAILRLFSMKGLSLVHGGLRAENIFFTRKNVPEFKLLDFSCAFFLDEVPQHLAELKSSNTAPELQEYACARTTLERSQYPLERVDHWALGSLLFQLHFKE